MRPTGLSTQRWLWYATETDDCVQLDRTAYAETVFDGSVVPLPDWVCRTPEGGLHINAGILQLDIEVAQLPGHNDEISRICDYGVRLIADTWLDQVLDLIDGSRIGLGKLRRNGEPIPGWSTIQERQPPDLLSTEGYVQTCALCSGSYSILHGREYFSDRAVIGRPLIVNSSGLFIREDIARSRHLRKPRGAFEPELVEFEPERF